MESENTALTELRNRLHSVLDKFLLKDFGTMTPKQIIQYQLDHPEDKRTEQYISRFCSPEMQQAILEQAEQLKQSIRYD